jgi:hypothetical protein
LIVDSLINSQKWQELSDEPIRGSLSLTIPLTEFQLKLTINEVDLENEEGSAVKIGGNFHYDPQAEETYDRNQELIRIIDKWEWCVSFFEDTLGLLVEEN